MFRLWNVMGPDTRQISQFISDLHQIQYTGRYIVIVRSSSKISYVGHIEAEILSSKILETSPNRYFLPTVTKLVIHIGIVKQLILS